MAGIFIDPLKSVFFRMIGRAQGDEIVNEGKETPELARAYGLPEHSSATVHWIFAKITPNSFRLALRTVGRWRVLVDPARNFARRVAS